MKPSHAVLRKVRDIEIRSRRLVSETFAGQYRSVFRGRGIDFDRVREYVAGDDVRAIDWNVTARAGRPFVKQFTEERELHVLLLVDLSASGDFGSTEQSKRELAAEIASVLALSAVRNGDRVGALLFTDRVERYVPARKGRAHVLRVVREILACDPEGSGTDIAGALEVAGGIAARRAVLLVVSDFQVGGERIAAHAELEHALHVAGLRHDVVALRIRDRREEELPDVGMITLEDAETGELVDVDTGRRKVREAFRDEALRARERVAALLRRAGVDDVELTTGEPYVPVLAAFFRRRERRLR